MNAARESGEQFGEYEEQGDSIVGNGALDDTMEEVTTPDAMRQIVDLAAARQDRLDAEVLAQGIGDARDNQVPPPPASSQPPSRGGRWGDYRISRSLGRGGSAAATSTPPRPRTTTPPRARTGASPRARAATPPRPSTPSRASSAQPGGSLGNDPKQSEYVKPPAKKKRRKKGDLESNGLVGCPRRRWMP